VSEHEDRPVESFEDFLGHTVKVGDHVVYATVDGRSPVQKYAEVVKIFDRVIERLRWDREAGRSVSEFHTETKVGVRELSNGRGFERWDTRVYDKDYRLIKDQKKLARVTYPMKANIVLIRTAKEIELAEREAEARAVPQRIVFGNSGQVPTDSPKPKGTVNLITFGEAAYE
jgi:hypothetical protein